MNSPVDKASANGPSADKPSADCLPRAKRLLFGMALLAIAAVAWSIAVTELQTARQLVQLLVNALVPLVLIQMIWIGRNWARYVLAVYCLFVMYDNFAGFAATREMMQAGKYSDAGFFVLVFVGHAAIGIGALCTNSLRDLLTYREAQKEKSTQGEA